MVRGQGQPVAAAGEYEPALGAGHHVVFNPASRGFAAAEVKGDARDIFRFGPGQ